MYTPLKQRKVNQAMRFVDLYLTYRNEYLTISKFAADKLMSTHSAFRALRLGKFLFNVGIPTTITKYK